MSYENIHTINLGKARLSSSQHRAARAINMIREYTQRHKHRDKVLIDEELSHYIWARGARRPPRKVTIEMTDDEDAILVGLYREEEFEPEETAVTRTDAIEDEKPSELETTDAALPGSIEETTDTTKQTADTIEETDTTKQTTDTKRASDTN